MSSVPSQGTKIPHVAKSYYFPTLTASFRQVMTAATVFSPVVAKLTRAACR